MMIALIGFNANAAMYIVGDSPFAGWHTYNGTEMTDNGNGTYSYKATISGTVWFVFADQLTAGPGDDWNTFNGQYRYGPASGGDEPVVTGTEYTTQRSASGAYKFTGSGEEYTFTFDEAGLKFKIEGDVEIPDVDTWTVAGSSIALFGTSWDKTNTDNDMTLVNGLYTWTNERAELTTSGFSFKVLLNHDWGTAYPSSNYDQAIDKHGYYKVVITFDAETHEITCTPTLLEEIIDVEDPIYTVAGTPAALFGTEWAPALEANEMTKGQDGIYTWTKNAVELTAGNVEFKVVLGHEWGQEWPSSNYIANIEENGTYDVTITFDPETKDITFEATPTVIVPDFYTVAGAPAAIFGEEWNPEYAANNMELKDGLYTWSKDSVQLAAETFIEFKVVKNANWDTCWPENNYEYTVAEDGIYNLVITYNPETNEVTFAANEPGGEEPPVEMVYTVVGPESIFGSNWNPADTTNDMILNEGVYTWTKEEVTLYGNFEFKVVGNHDYAIYEWPIGMNNWVANVAEEGIYTIEITFDPEAEDADRITCTLTKTGDIGPVEHTYTVAGTDNLFGSYWVATDEANDMVKGEDGIYTWTKNGVAFAAEDVVEFKVVQDHAWDYSWPSSNWYWQAEEEGTYDVVITFDPTADDMNKITFTATKQGAGIRGDVNNDGFVNISDVTDLINYLLTDNAEGINLVNANCNLDENINISDVTDLINFLLTDNWAE